MSASDPQGSAGEARVCDQCGRWVERDETLYHARLQLYAEPAVRIEEDNLSREQRRARWDAMIRRLEEMSDEEVEDATDQVHEEIAFQLCAECRSNLHERIRRGRYL